MSRSAVDTTVLPQCWQPAPTGDQGSAEADLLDARSISIGPTDDARVTWSGTNRRQRALVCPCPAWKRTMDIVGAIMMLVVLLPAFLGVAAFIKCVSRGPVLFRQRRYGLGGRPFKVWKFRTIAVSPESGDHRNHVTDLMTNNRTLQKRDHQLEIIPGGKLLRKFGIDELPQLVNVLTGEMSLVGPRPDVVPFSNYSKLHKKRFDVTPGITGLWQVNGKNRTTFERMMQLDLAYVRRRSFWFDVAILSLTIPALVWD
jgi:lipopolysaccharide/colanic/teichoic acid biosynthesis glycosyltransferase